MLRPGSRFRRRLAGGGALTKSNRDEHSRTWDDRKLAYLATVTFSVLAQKALPLGWPCCRYVKLPVTDPRTLLRYDELLISSSWSGLAAAGA